MTKIHEMHGKAFASTRVGGDVIEAHAKVTEDVAVRFAEWMAINNFYWSFIHIGYWLNESGDRKQTSELFAEFLTTLTD